MLYANKNQPLIGGPVSTIITKVHTTLRKLLLELKIPKMKSEEIFT